MCVKQGPEAHDQLLGRLFGYAAAIRSGQIQDTQLAVRCATALIGIASKKSFLRELAANVLLELTGVTYNMRGALLCYDNDCYVEMYLLQVSQLGVYQAAAELS